MKINRSCSASIKKTFYSQGGRTNGKFHRNYVKLSHKQIINTVTSLAALGNIEECVEKRDNSRPVCSQNFIALLVIYDIYLCVMSS